jgi:hypothetical protein
MLKNVTIRRANGITDRRLEEAQRDESPSLRDREQAVLFTRNTSLPSRLVFLPAPTLIVTIRIVAVGPFPTGSLRLVAARPR